MASKFKVGDRVRVVRVDNYFWKGLIGFTGTVVEVEELPTIEPSYNYEVQGAEPPQSDCRYLNEYMLEKSE